ncbi:transposase [Paenibacillus harenae]|uniref:transposase n=1 Tax=Paenibacillus harenae TaxID=306543 RepID=UPI00042215D4|nr:transposase [Paenibacillus harenae]
MDRIMKFNRLFPSDKDCIEAIHKLKWPSGFRCPGCEHHSAYTITTRRLPLYECAKCGRQSSLTSGTVMDKSRTPLRKWLLVMYIVATSENGINAVRLSALIKVTYKTAWSMLNKLRRTISITDRRTLLSGRVEAKIEIYMRQLLLTFDDFEREHAAIAARSISPDGSSYLKIKLVSCEQNPRTLLNKDAQQEFIDSHVHSDVAHVEFTRRYVNLPRTETLLPRLARKAFQWINDTFKGIGIAYSQLYLDEFCFRINHTNHSGHCPFQYLLQLCLNALQRQPFKAPI